MGCAIREVDPLSTGFEKVQVVLNGRNTIEIKGYIGASCIVAAAFAVLLFLHLPNLSQLAAADYGVIAGKPSWMAYQNRLLGPYLVLAMSSLGLRFETAWVIYNAIALETLGVLMFYLLRKEGLAIQRIYIVMSLFMLVFLGFQHYWLYTWDITDVVISTLFAYGILKSKPISYFLLLFLIGILNRESALFIAVYCMLDAFRFDVARWRMAFASTAKLVVGAALLVGGIFYIHFIRLALFISLPDGQPDVEHAALGNHLCYYQNIQDLFFNNFFNRYIVVSLMLIFSVLFFLSRCRKMQDQQLKCFLVLLVMILNILIFGILNETRMYFILFPFFMMLGLSLHGELKAAD